jgi:Ser/Thr protein kinase RdoA (MazF antagonist)
MAATFGAMPDSPPTPAIPATTSWQAVAEVFSLGAVLGIPGYVARGAMGEVWRLETSSGRWAVKWLFPWVAADPRPADVAFQLAAAAAGIPLPRPVLTADGAAVAAAGGRPARVYEWADFGAPLATPVPPAVAAEAGRLLGTLHGLGLPAGGPADPWYTAAPPDGYWEGLITRAAAAAAPWAGQLAGARGLITALSARVAPPSPADPLLLCHRDFNPDNLLPAGPDGRLTVLDWENAGPLSPGRELGYAVFTWCAGGGRFDAAAADALVTGYAETAGAVPVLGADAFATAIATHLNVLRVMAEKWLTEPGDRDHAAAMIADMLDEYLADLRATTVGRATGWPAGAGTLTLERRPRP